jgi:uncharacterized membrane protein YphA (DoxX/SURF4 family)
MAAGTQDVSSPARGPSGAAAVLGHVTYAASVAGIGGLLLWGTFVYVWAPIPQWVPARHGLACAAGALMLALAVALLWRKTVVPSAAGLTLLFLGWLLLVQTPRIMAAPSRELLWSGGAQLASVVAGGWIVFATLTSPTAGPGRQIRGVRGVRLARLLFAVALPMFGLHHFFDLAGAAEAVPAWLPFALGWAYLTGAGHIAAGVGILLGIVPRLSATLESIMITSFVLFVHVPGVIGAPRDLLQWTMLVVAAAIGGAAWIVAGSYRRIAPSTSHAKGSEAPSG